MQAVIAGRGRRQGQGRGRYVHTGASGVYLYTGALSGSGECTVWRCCTLLSFGLSSISALCGIMLTVFGLTNFFRTTELNNAFLIVGIVLLLSALVLIGIGIIFNRRSQAEQLALTSRTPANDEIPSPGSVQ